MFAFLMYAFFDPEIVEFSTVELSDAILIVESFTVESCTSLLQVEFVTIEFVTSPTVEFITVESNT